LLGDAPFPFQPAADIFLAQFSAIHRNFPRFAVILWLFLSAMALATADLLYVKEQGAGAPYLFKNNILWW
jgi:hypothetical protein